jgi:hypothetical protein
MAKSKQNLGCPVQTVIIVFGDFNKKEKEPLPSWEDVVKFENSIDQPLCVSWPHRRVRKTRLYKKWQRYAATLRRFVVYLQAGLPISPGMAAAFYEVKGQSERARCALLEHKKRRR